MITFFQLIRNVGRFDSFTGGAQTSFARLAVLYAENGRGKTTLAAILRSLATGDPVSINERRRLSAQQPPHVVVQCAGGPAPAMFQNGIWSRYLPELRIFDDHFVDENVYSGLAVGVDHRQNLHELILGAQGIALNQTLQGLITRVEAHNAALRQKGAALPQALRGTLNVDQFCALPANPNVDAEIQEAERNLAAAREQDPVRNTPLLPVFEIPAVDTEAIAHILARGVENLDAEAAAMVNDHLATMPTGSERWVAEGMRLQQARPPGSEDECPFCAQGLEGSPVISHYRAFFSEAYRSLQGDLARADDEMQRAHSGDAVAVFERTVRTLVERKGFWGRFETLPAIELEDNVIRIWQESRATLARLLASKRANPLEPSAVDLEASAAFTAHAEMLQQLGALNEAIRAGNVLITAVKERAAAANPAALQQRLEALRIAKARHETATDTLCLDYLSEQQAKATTEGLRDQAREALDQYRAGVFPRYQGRINHYLGLFGAGFELGNVLPANTRGGPTCTYNVVINNTPVAVAGGTPQPGHPSFRNTVSAGDRNALALAFFFATIDLDPTPGDKVVIIDDPMSSLDEHRSLVTVQQIRQLATRVSQVIVLSHSKPFLCHVWAGSDRNNRSAAQVIRNGTGSSITPWNVENDSITEHDRRHGLLQSYHVGGAGPEREVAVAVRPHLEAFIRVAYPEHFPPGSLLGPFREICGRRLNQPDQILSPLDHQELTDLIEYGNLFHHDTNASYLTQTINSQQLTGFVGRALAFTRRN